MHKGWGGVLTLHAACSQRAEKGEVFTWLTFRLNYNLMEVLPVTTILVTCCEKMLYNKDSESWFMDVEVQVFVDPSTRSTRTIKTQGDAVWSVVGQLDEPHKTLKTKD